MTVGIVSAGGLTVDDVGRAGRSAAEDHASLLQFPGGPLHSYLAHSVFQVVLQKSISAQTRQLILYYY